jgi:hypothetical protein
VKVKQILDLVENRLKVTELTLKTPIPDRLTLQLFLSHAIYQIVEKESWSWAIVYLKPALQTAEDVESYMLPRDFGENFIRGGHEGHSWTVHTSNGTVDSDLYYESPSAFFSRDKTSQPTNQPERYTILTSGGRRFMYVSPIPDGSYTIWGAYRPIWDVDNLGEDDDIFVPNHSVLLYGTLLQIEPRQDWAMQYAASMQDLYNAEGRTMKPRLHPATSDRSGYADYFDPMRGGGV